MTDDEIVDAVAREMSRRKGFGEFGAMVRDVLTALRDTGLAVVPVEPTEAMQDAGINAALNDYAAADCNTSYGKMRRRLTLTSYRAMIEAAR